MVEFRGGRLPADPTKRRVRLGAFLAAAPAPPASVDWYGRISDWPMFLNDQLGDCTEAMVGHVIQNTSTYGDGATVTITDDDVEAAYERVGGYVPGDPSTDQGAILQSVYEDWVKNGVGRLPGPKGEPHKALAFGELDHTNLTEVKTGVNTFGAVGLGIVVTQEMMDDFNAGEPWSRPGNQQLGGHAVPVVGYDKDNVYVVTWAKVQPMTWACFREVTDETWAAILPEWVNDVSGLDPLGVDVNGLGEALAELTGTNPFPTPQPTPTPPSPPDPTPPVPPQPVPVDAADKHLARIAHRFVEHHVSASEARSALATWLHARNL